MIHSLTLVENLVWVSSDIKTKLVESGFDQKLAQFVHKSKADDKEDWFKRSEGVVRLLQSRDSQESMLQNTPLVEQINQKSRSGVANQVKVDQTLLQTERYQLLVKGCDVKLYSEHGKGHWVSLFVLRDLSEIRCKRLGEDWVREKWVMKMQNVRVVQRGFDQNSPIRNSSEFFFRKLPSEGLCFAVLGEFRSEGTRNFHFVCENQPVCQQWFEGLSLLVKVAKEEVKRRTERT